MFLDKDDSEKPGKEIIHNLYYFQEKPMLDCNQYIVNNDETNEISVFDAGNALSLESLLKGMENLKLNYKNISKIFVTHEHVDHVLGIYKLMNILKDHPPEIYAYGNAAKVLEKGDRSKILPIALGLTERRFGINITPLQVTDLSDFKEIEISPDFKFQIHSTPGHSPGSVSYYEGQKKVLISGDIVFIGGNIGRFDFPGGSLQMLIKSIKLVKDLDVKYVLPGHMRISENGNTSIELSYRMAESMGNYY
ncbi:MAG: MBL fold metallo-hydrolase [Promethearchaeota archaeon]|jgi:glyoxylase-like metal-dependent hydrolase (beta-lactamase superfamily II)